MRVLVFARHDECSPFVPELVAELRKHEVEVDVLDSNDGCIVGLDGRKQHRAVLRLLMAATRRVPRLRRIVSSIATRKTLMSLRPYDVINIHWLSTSYSRLMRVFRSRCSAIAITVWGSDFLRADEARRASFNPILAHADLVMFGSREAKAEFDATYGPSRYPVKVIPFGHRSFDVIDRLRASERPEETRRILGLPADRKLVALGYNASRAQQHLTMLEATAALPEAVKRRVFLAIPMTYPKDPAYVDQVDAAAKQTGIPHRIWDSYMTKEDACRLRVVSDVVVNIQTTDMFSASIQEHCYCGSTMIVGRWLPYGVLEEMGFALVKVERDSQITDAITEAVVAGRRKEDDGARRRLYELSGWPGAAARWIGAFHAIANEGRGG